MKKSVIAIAIASAAALSACGQLPSVPGGLNGVTGTGSTTQVSEGVIQKLVATSNSAANNFLLAQIKVAKALDVYDDFSAKNDTAKNLKSGDLAKLDLSEKATISKPLDEEIDKAMEKNAPLDTAHKKMFVSASIDYAKALLELAKLGVQAKDVAKNPAAIPLNQASAVASLGSNIPGLVTRGFSSSSAMVKYMKANGIDSTQVTKNLDAMPK